MSNHDFTISAGAALLLASCAPVPAPEQPPQLSQEQVDEACGIQPGGQGFALIYGPQAIYPGESTVIYPRQYVGPAIMRIDPQCLSDLDVAPIDGVTLEPIDSGGWRLQTAEDIIPGTVVTITATLAGSHPAESQVAIYDVASNPLVGIWSQSAEDCGQSAIRELRFSQRGYFTVTWQPFETYNDYWGAFVFDEETGSLVLAIEDGNEVPFIDLTQALLVNLDGDSLSLEAGSFGDNPSFGECRAPFTRRRNG